MRIITPHEPIFHIKKAYWQLVEKIPFSPNELTFARIPLVAISATLAIYGWQICGLIAYALAWTLDLLDGDVARTQNKTSTLGEILDPAADKFMFLTMGVVFMDHLWLLVFLTIITIELALLTIRLVKMYQAFDEQERPDLKAVNHGKYKANLEFSSIALIFLVYPWLPAGDNIFLQIIVSLANTALCLALFYAGASLKAQLRK